MIHVIPSLKISSKGLTVRGQKILLSQGDMDGACTIYSLMMALQIIGVTTRSDATNIWKKIKGSTRKGKLISALMENKGLVRGGLELKEVREILDRAMGKIVKSEYVYLDNDELLENTVKKEIEKGNPLLISISYNTTSGHALTAIGYDEDNKGNIKNIFCLDPASPKVDIGYWNAVISLDVIGGKYKDYYLPSKEHVLVDEVIKINKID